MMDLLYEDLLTGFLVAHGKQDDSILIDLQKSLRSFCQLSGRWQRRDPSYQSKPLELGIYKEKGCKNHLDLKQELISIRS